MEDILKYLDESKKIKTLPKKRLIRFEVLKYLVSHLEYNHFYTEKEINQFLNHHHTFNDYFLLRRELINHGLLSRKRDGSKYWRSDVVSETYETERLYIRDSKIEDLDDLISINRSCSYLEKYTGNPHEDSYIQKILTEGDLPLNGSLEFYHVKTIIEKESQNIIGFIEYYLGYPDHTTLWVSTLYILKEEQHKGYGKEIMDDLYVRYKDSGVSRIALGVHIKNWEALNFWIKCGFVGIIGFYGDKVYHEKHFALLGLEKSFKHTRINPTYSIMTLLK